METSFEEIRQLLKELVISQKETDAKFKETDAKFKETDAKFKETKAMFEANAIEAKELSKELSRKIKEQGKQIGNIGERFGSFTEGLAYPSLRKVLKKYYGIENTVANIVKDFPDGRQIEFDAFGYTNGTVNNAVIAEVKTNLQSKHIYEFKAELENFKNDFPEFKDKHLYGILVTPKIISKELKGEVFANGLHLAVVHDDIFDFDQNPKAIDFNT